MEQVSPKGKIMGNAGFTRISRMLLAFCLAMIAVAHAQTYTRLVKFNGEDGKWPLYGPLLQGSDGNFWGTTGFGGAGLSGSVFKITLTGEVTTVYSFCPVPQTCTGGRVPYYGLLQDTAGNFFGTTYEGGTAGQGILFELTPDGVITTIHNFCSETDCADGYGPASPLVEGPDGDFYGWPGNSALYYKVTPSGVYSTLDRTFIPATVGSDGRLWGFDAGAYEYGGIAVLEKTGEIKTVYSFCSHSPCLDGSGPSSLIQAADGNFYGETYTGGTSNGGVIFKFTPSGEYSVLYSFCSQPNCADGYDPYGGLIQGTDGNFYGTTTFGGTAVAVGQFWEGFGTVFRITPHGVYKVLHTFCGKGGLCQDGSSPMAALVQGTDGNFYGTASGISPALDKCPGSCGVVFRISAGLAPFVEANPPFGKTGHIVNILGNNLTGATSVTFNGVAATFTVNASGTAIEATVPSGATTGTIEVATPSGTLSSNVAFQVLP
jgi:uncharacterized repeat protein (TIGR03803 family)